MSQAIGATSWLVGGAIHLRVYSLQQNGTLTERCWDTNGWYTGALTAKNYQAITGAGATSWLDSKGQIHIRVYSVGVNGKIMEYCWDTNDWYVGALSNHYYASEAPNAVSWLDANGTVHLRVYANNQDNVATEYCWDGSSWVIGGYKQS